MSLWVLRIHRYPWRLDDGVGASGTGVPGSYELSNICAGI